MLQILRADCFPKENVTALMMRYKKQKQWFRERKDPLAPYLFIICLDYALLMPRDLTEKNLTLKKPSSGQYPTKNHIDVDNADDIALLAKYTCDRWMSAI